MKKLLGKGKRVIAMLMVVLLVLGLVPISPIEVNATEGDGTTPVANTLTINMDESKGVVTVIKDSDSSECTAVVDEIANVFTYELLEGETYTVTFADNPNTEGDEVVYGVFSGDNEATLNNDGSLSVAITAESNSFTYDVKFVSDTKLVTVKYNVAEIASASINGGKEETPATEDGDGFTSVVYRVLTEDDINLTVTPSKNYAIVATDVGTSIKDIGEGIYTYTVGITAEEFTNDEDGIINLSVEKVTINASSYNGGTTLNVYEDDVEVSGTEGAYTLTKGSNCHIVINTTLDFERLVAKNSEEILYEILNDNGTYKIDLGVLTESKTVVVSEKEFPKVTITIPTQKVTGVTLADTDGNPVGINGTPVVNGDTTTYEFEGKEGSAYVATITPNDDDAIVTAGVYDVFGTVGDRTIEIPALAATGTTAINVGVENQYTLSFNQGYGTVYRVDTASNNKILVENGELLIGENNTNITLEFVPEAGTHVSGLQLNSVNVDFDASKLTVMTNESVSTVRYVYTYEVSIVQDSNINVEYSPISTETVLIENVLDKTFGDAENDSAVIENDKEVYYINSDVTLTLNNTINGTLLFAGDNQFDAFKKVDSSMEIAGVTVLNTTTDFSEGMIKYYDFEKDVRFVLDKEIPAVPTTTGSTVYFGPNSKTVTLKAVTSDNNAISKVVYFKVEKDIVNDRAEILASQDVLTLQDGSYVINIEETATADMTYYIYAIDVAENISRVDYTVRYDDVAPTGGTITIEDITSFIDFTYVQSNIIKVEATDIMDVASGIQYIDVTLKRRTEELQTVRLDENNKATFTYQLVEGETYYVSVVAYDNVNNSITIAEAAIQDGFSKIIYDYAAPSISLTPQLSAHSAGVYKQNDNTFYISKEVFDKGFLFDVLVKDYAQSVRPNDYYVAGLESVTVKINGQDITKDKNANPLINYEDITNGHIYDASFVINLSQGVSTDGKYVIELSAKDQAGNATEIPVVYIVYVDGAAPTIGTISVNEVEAQKGEFQGYGFFTKDKFDIQISGMDGNNGEVDSKIDYYVVEYIEGDTVVKKETVSGTETTFTKQITDNFKGTLKLTAYDKVGNYTTTTLTNGLICEKETTHAANASAVLTTQETSMKDVNGIQLYAENTMVNVVITDTYAGINKIEWSVVAPYDVANNASGSMTMNTLASGWVANATDNGIVTNVSGTIVVANNSNNIVVKVVVTDNAGNVTVNNVVISIDKTTPVINLTMSGDEADTQYTNTFNGDRTATITVRERNFKAEDVSVVITNTDGTIPTVTDWVKTEDTSNPDNNIYTATVTFSADGDYTLDVTYTDSAERKASAPTQQSFTIDKTLPKANVSIDGNAVNEFYYATSRTATIVVEEHNFDAGRITLTGTANNNGATVGIPSIGSWSTSGNTHTAIITFSADANYNLVLSGIDQAGNTFEYEITDFVIDQEVPTISITGVEDQSANAGDVIPVITFGDVNYDTNGVNITLVGANNGTMELDGTFFDAENGQVFTFNNFPNEQSYDDIYTLTATKTDMAGNETTETITFSVNRFGSVYTLSDELKAVVGKYVKEPFTIVLTETNIDRLDPETIKVVLTINGTPKTLVRDVDYTITESGSDGTWKQYVYTISTSVFEGDGSYSLAIYSVDRAGNVNENINEVKQAEVIFGIDATAPIIEAINFESGFTNETAYLAMVSAIDNIILASLQVFINGEAVEVTEENGMYSFTIPESSSKQTVVITATDSAGNITTVEYTDILITSNAFISFINNTPLLIGSITGVAAVGVGAGGFVFFRKRNVIKVKK